MQARSPGVARIEAPHEAKTYTQAYCFAADPATARASSTQDRVRCASAAGQHDRVDDQVRDDDEHAEGDLDAAREPHRIDQRNQVVVDEAAFVSGFARDSAQRVLERRQRTGPTEQ